MVNKITSPITPLGEIDKINEIIDELDNANVAIDSKSITKNSSDELQTVGVIDSNNTTNAIKTWTGTKAQYEAITTKDATTLYNITDDTDVTLPLLELLYPVGSIYIGTMATCPLSVLGIGTWQLVAQDRVLQGAGTRGAVGSEIDESLPNIKGSYDSENGQFTLNDNPITTGAISNYKASTTIYISKQQNTAIRCRGFNFNANNSSSTYQDNAPVQQDGYLVNIWERTA